MVVPAGITYGRLPSGPRARPVSSTSSSSQPPRSTARPVLLNNSTYSSFSSDVPSRYIYQNFSANLGQSLSASTVMLLCMAVILIPWIRMEFGKKKQA